MSGGDGRGEYLTEVVLVLVLLLLSEVVDHEPDHILGVFVDGPDHHLAEDGVDVGVDVV